MTNPHSVSPPRLERVFVYGTLKRGYGNDHLLRRGIFIGEGVTAARFPLVVGRLPYLIMAPGAGHRVHGELYDVDPRTFRALDQLEGHPIWYRREKIRIIHGSFTDHSRIIHGPITSLAWTYFTQSEEIIHDFRSRRLVSNFSLQMLRV